MRQTRGQFNFPERRQRPRIITLRNFGIASAVAIVGFVAISIRSEYRGRNVDGDYGRLYGSQVGKQEVAVKNPEIVVEDPGISDDAHADPMLTAAAAREQYLYDRSRPAGVAAEPVQASIATAPAPVRSGEGDVAIVGGPEGVTVVKTATATTPKLTGGIFREPQPE
ncbi:MAG TPA: hypothetical protein VF698_11475 [Thermoanaerobaculia bacterium]|jgi:hypothetical protein